MSEISDMIQRLCPDGVEYRKIKEIAEVGTGSSDRKDAIEDGSYPFYVRSKDVLKKNSFEFDEEAIIIPGEGGIGEIFHYANGKYALHQRAYRIHFTTNIITKFAYYYFSNSFKAFIFQKAVNATVTSIRKPMIEDFEIPVPPLEVQRKIVEVLDNFSELTAELEAELSAELEARQKQYEYYRDNLLNFNRGQVASDVKWMKMSEVFEIRNGYTPSKAKPEFWESGIIPWFRMEDIRQNGRILSDSILHITSEGVKGKGLFKANSFILATTATIGEHALIIADSLANQRFTNLTICKSLENELTIKYVFYYLFVVDEWCKANTNVSGFASVDMAKFKNLLFPIPPLAEQERIVSILDRFEALTTDLTAGLPAEIKARQQQYEYYRDQLLTFKRAN